MTRAHPEPVGSGNDRERFANLNIDRFRELASRDDLSPNEKSGFPDAFRHGRTDAILEDILTKLPRLAGPPGVFVDLGVGCSDLAHTLVGWCFEKGHHLILVDIEEVLRHHPDRSGLSKIVGTFPKVASEIAEIASEADGVLAYSVLQYTGPHFAEFIREASDLLAPGGRCLIGDIPNADMRVRFIESEAGARYQAELWGPAGRPGDAGQPVPGEPRDDMLLTALTTLRRAGLHAWLVPQAPGLPMASRREDLLIERP